VLKEFCGRKPKVHPDAYVDEAALIIGEVVVEEGANIWPGVVLRGDIEPIHIGRGTSIQDCTVMHTDPGYPVEIGKECTIAHGCIIHGCRVGNGSLVAMGAIILTGAEVGEGCLIGAGALLPEGKVIPSGSVALGMPAKVVRPVANEDLARIRATNEAYQRLMRRYRG
jgi:carbonic anhydrase/acetyltransferase-like protein (isoleucine patch superfamily)